jgi:acetolactate synthase-1/3 small subunit
MSLQNNSSSIPDTLNIISVWVENRFGVLSRVSGLFSARGFNIESLAVGPTQDPSVSRMTVVVRGDERTIEQVVKQLNKLIDIIKVKNLSHETHLERELVLVKLDAKPAVRGELLDLVDIFRARVIDVSPKAMILEMVGAEEKIASLLDLLAPYGIRELVRTGRIAMTRSSADAGERKPARTISRVGLGYLDDQE